MSSSDPRSWLDKAVGVCLAALVGAAALYIAVRLIQAVAAVLLVVLGVGVFVALAVALLRARNGGW
jgi:hypothetical protein